MQETFILHLLFPRNRAYINLINFLSTFERIVSFVKKEPDLHKHAVAFESQKLQVTVGIQTCVSTNYSPIKYHLRYFTFVLRKMESQ